jgi:hypothetical protein
MPKDMGIRIDLNTNDHSTVGQVSSSQPKLNRLGFQALESRHMPLVVIAIIAILIGLLLPA